MTERLHIRTEGSVVRGHLFQLLRFVEMEGVAPRGSTPHQSPAGKTIQMVWFLGKSSSSTALLLPMKAKGLSFLYAWSLEPAERTVSGLQPFAVVNCSWQVSLFPKQFNKGSCKTTEVLVAERLGNKTTQIFFCSRIFPCSHTGAFEYLLKL